MSLESLFFVSFLSLVSFSGWAQNSPTKPTADLVPLSKILEDRAQLEELVPAAAANDQDFIRFITAIRSRVSGSGSPRMIARRFELESQTSGANAYEMYQRIQTMLSGLRGEFEILSSALNQNRLGNGYSSQQFCVSAHVCLGFGIKLGVGLGVEKRGRWIVPVFSLRTQITTYQDNALEIGAIADMGIENRQSPSTPKMIEKIDGQSHSAALAIGGADTEYKDNGSKYRGLAVGVGAQFSDAQGYQFKLPIFFPIPTANLEGRAIKLQSQLANAIQRFDLTRAAQLVAEFRSAVAKVDEQFAERAGKSLDRLTLEDGHPFLSPGLLFSGSSLVMYSPDLVPDLVEIYSHSNRRKGKQLCESGVIDVVATAVAADEKSAKKLPE